MLGLGLIGSIVVGIVAGFVAEKVMNSNHGLLTNLIVGVIGGLVGGFLAQKVLPGILTLTGMGWVDSIIVASLGAILVLFVYQKIRS
ncbi:GlsB/YeaQ/YmgE family stress response membrane protein [Cohaesibacter celericrescens]|uniref:GlsB/YeaQ/YmgE family stress response membrane protein n=1 Tax=Cohaesibacter celericrescens TaxID=2067669 RepID=A0A2N5XSU8_9HYPH|nr:GlsB/YeaQ/YmgE family stress response membrane protein [Cohaesibacter celericrescens]PLW77579.1 GlsB/YeaQ/YmgE family stress response membrane protein [Cohaesibacter celericrescens]